MKIGTTIRHQMGSDLVVKDTDSLIDIISKIKDIDFIELYCTYPIPLILDDADKLKNYLTEKNIAIGLHFPVEWHDRWKTKRKFSELINAIVGFGNDVGAVYINIHPADIRHFTGTTDKDSIKKIILDIQKKFNGVTLIENGHSEFQHPDDIDFFSSDGVKITLDICHIHQSNQEFETFKPYLEKWKDKLFLVHISDKGERPHMQIGTGSINFKKILKDLKEMPVYGILSEAILTYDNELIIRHPLKATQESVNYLRKVIE